ncbi:hypothetical protein JOC75_003205 [Metabacillus crassostreae]|uniref:hypothetical protein n=1 Tax=Metabacillus crassostreae TaxID=929098 RepID=UPI00195ED11D|nr:hypothetical protein [Metabacillus crassostreae]MBM7605182.1 hypothetical protein [Metabacillus crassostreae]
MNIIQVAKLLNRVGKLVETKDGYLKEKEFYSENYYQLSEVDGVWEFGLVMIERTNNPKMRKLKEFSTETEGAKYFFLDRLSSFFFSEKVRPFMMAHDELDIGGSNFDIDMLFKTMSLLSIPSSLLIKAKQKVKQRSIQLERVDETNYIVSFIGEKGEIIHSTIPINDHRALFIAFKKVYMLHLYEQEVTKLLEDEEIINDFSENDINLFLQ